MGRRYTARDHTRDASARSRLSATTFTLSINKQHTMSKVESGLFVAEDEELNYPSETESPAMEEDAIAVGDDNTNHTANPLDCDEDPIVESIPLVISALPSDLSSSIHVLQYPGRPKLRPLDHGHLEAQVKPELRFLGLKVPLDTTKFFDGSKADKWGEEIATQEITGVLNKLDGTLYAGQVVFDKRGSKRVVLIPVDSTGQLRPSFKYMDAADNAFYAQNRAEQNETKKPTNIQILQTSAKLSRQITNQDGAHQSALGEALRSIKKFDEEQWLQLQWNSAADETAESLRKAIVEGIDDTELKTEATMSSYIDSLVNA